MGSRHKYPEAADKAAVYAAAETYVSSRIAIVQRAVDLSISEDMMRDDAALEGAYYTRYSKVSNSWVGDVQGLKGRFSNFNDDLRGKLEEIVEKKEMWQNRINEMEYFEDEE